MENSNVIVSDSSSCKYVNTNTKCCCSLSCENNNNIHIVLENPQNKEMSVSVFTQDKEISITVTTKNDAPKPIIENKVPIGVFTQNENEYYCKYCQIGNCVKREKEHLKIIHRKLTYDEKCKFTFAWHLRLAMSDSYARVYKKAFDDLAGNKFIEDSKTRSKFTYMKDKKYGLLTIVIDVIFKGSLLIFNPHLVYILKDENTNNVYQASWCRECVGATTKCLCPSYTILDEHFKPTMGFDNLGVQMRTHVTMTTDGLKIHSPLCITKQTYEVKKIANPNFAKEYATERYQGETYPKMEFPLPKSFHDEILNIHKNVTKPSIKKIYNDEIKVSSQ